MDLKVLKKDFVTLSISCNLPIEINSSNVTLSLDYVRTHVL